MGIDHISHFLASAGMAAWQKLHKASSEKPLNEYQDRRSRQHLTQATENSFGSPNFAMIEKIMRGLAAIESLSTIISSVHNPVLSTSLLISFSKMFGIPTIPSDLPSRALRTRVKEIARARVRPRVCALEN
jgi:hypothetical protein